MPGIDLILNGLLQIKISLIYKSVHGLYNEKWTIQNSDTKVQLLFFDSFFQVIDSIHKFKVIIDNRIFFFFLFFENFNCLKFVI